MRTATSALVAFVPLVALATGACGGGVLDLGGDADSAADGGMSAEGGASSSGGAEGSDSGGPSLLTGALQFAQNFDRGYATVGFTASFPADLLGFGDPADMSCRQVASYGACNAYFCSQSGPAHASAGTLDLSGGSIPAGTYTSDPGAYGVTLPQPFTAGQTLTVVASGGDVPAFGPASIVAPAFPTLLAPILTYQGQSESYVLPPTSDLTVSWTGSSPGARILLMLAPPSATGSDIFDCEWPASQGQGVVPQSILSSLAAESPDGASLLFGQYSENDFTAGSYSIVETAMQYTTGPVNYQ